MSEDRRRRNADAFIEILAIAFRRELAHERGLFRAFISMWFAHRQGGWFLQPYLSQEEKGRARWLNRFEVPRRDFVEFVHAINTGVGEGRFFVSENLRKRLDRHGIVSTSESGCRVYVEHAIPVSLLERRIRSMIADSNQTETTKVIGDVLEQHFTLGWMLESEQAAAMPTSKMPEGIDPFVTPLTSNSGFSKDYKTDPHFARYWIKDAIGGVISPRPVADRLSGFDREIVTCAELPVRARQSRKTTRAK